MCKKDARYCKELQKNLLFGSLFNRHGFFLPENQIKPVGEEIWAAMREVAITAANPEEF